MQTIQAMVNPRLLTKANRLFTGTLQGRIIEILQNARRAGATKVEITHQDGVVTVQDNGRGIDDFSKLLDMGGSGWEEALEESEDPAGVGLFCLAPREVAIRSNGKRIIIHAEGWTGECVEIQKDPQPIQGTVLQFKDEPWDAAAVDINAVFLGVSVTVDGVVCPQATFISDQAIAHPELGCRIEVRESADMNHWHHSCNRGHYGDNVLVNFHGQVVSFHHNPANVQNLHFLIDMTGEPTGIRLMLPARTCLVQNEAYEALLAAMEMETFRYLQRRGHHRLAYKEYLRAQQLGIVLPEATPTFHVGLLSGDAPEPIEVFMPDGFPLAKCYTVDGDHKGSETDDANIHLLAALGQFAEPFVPVDIHPDYTGYSWANLPTIGKVQVKVGKLLQEDTMWSGYLACVDSLTTTVHTSDGRKWTSPVCMATRPATGKQKHHWWDEELLVTPEAQSKLNATHLLYHLGGYSDEGDTWETQDQQFSDELDHFWDRLVGPDENLRRRIFETIGRLEGWQRITLTPNGRMVIHLANGKQSKIQPPG